MTEWFYVKNDLKSREDIKRIIMRPIWQHFGLRRPKVEMNEAAEECQRAFGVVCSFIGTRDLVQEHIAFRVWPLAEKWEMPKETIKETDEGGLVRLKYTFKYGDKFVEPDDDWLKSIEAISDELLGVYSKAEDTALSAVTPRIFAVEFFSFLYSPKFGCYLFFFFLPSPNLDLFQSSSGIRFGFPV
jgi:hypothetical protein